MTMPRLIRGELRKLTTTKLLWGFLAVVALIAALNAAIVAFGTDTDGSKAFVATAADQQSLMAFAFNAMLGTALFAAIAAAREYGPGTVVPTFLPAPNAGGPSSPSSPRSSSPVQPWRSSGKHSWSLPSPWHYRPRSTRSWCPPDTSPSCWPPPHWQG
jgi:hypothetical protein